MTPQTRTDLHAAIEVRFPDNTTRYITPQLLRDELHELVDSVFVTASDPSTTELAKNIGLVDAQTLAKNPFTAPKVKGNVLYNIESNAWNGGKDSATIAVHGVNPNSYAPIGYAVLKGVPTLVEVDVAGGTFQVFAVQAVPAEKQYAANEVVAGSPAGNALLQFKYLASLLSTGGGAAAPMPTITGFLPMQGAQGSTVVLSGTGFTGATQVSINSAAVARFTVNSATQITAVLTSSQATGKVRVTTPGGTAVSSADFTVQVATTPTTPTTTAVLLAHHADSAGIERVGADGYKIRAMGASISRRTNGAYLDLLVRASANYANANFTVLVDGVFSATYYVQTNEATGKAYRIALPNDGQPHTVRVILGDLLRANEAGDVQGVEFVSITEPAGATGTWLTPVGTGTQALVDGDSITNEYPCTSPGLSGGWSQNQTSTQRITRVGYGSAQAAVQFAAGNDSFIEAAAAATWANATDKVYILTPGTNDPTLSAADAEALYTRRIKYVHARHPTARICIITLLPRTDEGNRNTAAVRTGQRAAAQALGVPIMEGSGLYDPTTGNAPNDPVHPTQATNTNVLKAFYQQAINTAAVPTKASTLTTPLLLNGTSQYVELEDSGSSLTNLPGWGYGGVVKLNSIVANMIAELISKAVAGTGNNLAQNTYIVSGNTANVASPLYADWSSTGTGPTGGNPGYNLKPNQEIFFGASFGNGVPFMVIGTTVLPLQSSFVGNLSDSSEPVRWGAGKKAATGTIGEFLAGTLKNLSLFSRALTQAELLYLAGTSGGKEVGALTGNTGTLTYADPFCLVYSTLDPAMQLTDGGGQKYISNLAQSGARRLLLQGY
jgi:hypothetical protein